MLRVIHSADWQLGARFSQFGTKASRLREARLATLKRTLDLAVQHEADAFLIAGDHAFENLSQGAKDQLLLYLRLAVAQELATDEPQVLILDDVLVNTDPVRQERILDVLGTQAPHLQILIITCHPDRYRGVGHPVLFAL